MIRSIFFLFVLTVLTATNLFAQEREIRLANEYFLSGEYEKARSLYDELAGSDKNISPIYNNYVKTLKELNEYKDAEKFIKDAIKEFPGNVYYKIDMVTLLSEYKGEQKAQKYYEDVVEEFKSNNLKVQNATSYLIKRGRYAEAKQLYLAAREESETRSAYALGLAQVYYALSHTGEMINELLMFLKDNSTTLDVVKNTLQSYLRNASEYDQLERILYERIQDDPQDIAYNELLLWLNIQNLNFRSAFLQAKAIDKRKKTEGSKMLEVGKIALENKAYDEARRYFKYIIDEYPHGYNNNLARRYLINAKEASVKSTYPVDENQIHSLIKDYNKLITEFGNSAYAFDPLRRVALLYGFYLNEKDSAITLLNKAVELAGSNRKDVDRAKLDLADIHLLKGNPWTASLIYSQVEKSQKEDLLGHEAKLKNAKQFYYRGEFELAQAHLDILKLATTREISNDAIRLSLLIKDNTALDTSYDVMKEYAGIDLLLFQNKDSLAMTKVKDMQSRYSDHPIQDELLWMQSKILRKRKEFNKAIEALQQITTKYKTDILGDDALYTIGLIYEEDLRNKEEAMNTYKNFLIEYPGSIFTSEARKKFRELRGDQIN